MGKVKRKTGADATVITAANLRAFMGRHMISYSEIGRRRGVTCDAVSQALRSDQTGRPVSGALLRALWQVANDVLIERECQNEKLSGGGT